MTFGAPSPRPSHCATCSCGPKRAVFEELRLRRQAAEYIESLGPTGGNIDGDFGGMDAERIAPFVDYLAEEASRMGFAIAAEFNATTGRLITTIYKGETTT